MGSIVQPLNAAVITANGSANIRNQNGYDNWSDYTELLTQLEVVAGS